MNDLNVLSFPELGWEFSVSDEAFTIFGLSVKWYGILIMAGLFIAIMYCTRRMKSFGIEENRAIDAVLAGLVGAIIGARLYYVIMNLEEYDSFIDVISIRNGGLAIYGGIIGALLFGGIACKIRKVKIAPLFDLAGLGFLIGIGIGRWGNFFNHEAFGSNTSLPWGMTSAKIQHYLTLNSDKIFETVGVSVDPNVPVHPCFLYEFLWCALGFLLLHIYSKRRKFDGELFFMFIGWYGLGRFFNESLRTDSLMIGHIRVSQAVAALSVLASVAFITVMRIKIKKRGEYVFYRDTEESKALLKEAADRQEALKTKKALKKSEKAAALELKPEDRIISAEEDEETLPQQDSDE